MRNEVFSLLQKHQSLDEHLQLEQGRSLPDPARIQRLRQLKQGVKHALISLGGRRVLQPA